MNLFDIPQNFERPPALMPQEKDLPEKSAVHIFLRNTDRLFHEVRKLTFTLEENHLPISKATYPSDTHPIQPYISVIHRDEWWSSILSGEFVINNTSPYMDVGQEDKTGLVQTLAQRGIHLLSIQDNHVEEMNQGYIGRTVYQFESRGTRYDLIFMHLPQSENSPPAQHRFVYLEMGKPLDLRNQQTFERELAMYAQVFRETMDALADFMNLPESDKSPVQLLIDPDLSRIEDLRHDQRWIRLGQLNPLHRDELVRIAASEEHRIRRIA